MKATSAVPSRLWAALFPSQWLLRTGSCDPDRALEFSSLVSMEYIQRNVHQTHKEPATISESCETVDPGLITQTLLPLLEVNSMRVSLQSSEKANEMKFTGLGLQRRHGDVVLFDLCSGLLYSTTFQPYLMARQRELAPALIRGSASECPCKLIQWLLSFFSSKFSILA
jgi:hypothetical protein